MVITVWQIMSSAHIYYSLRKHKVWSSEYCRKNTYLVWCVSKSVVKSDAAAGNYHKTSITVTMTRSQYCSSKPNCWQCPQPVYSYQDLPRPSKLSIPYYPQEKINTMSVPLGEGIFKTMTDQSCITPQHSSNKHTKFYVNLFYINFNFVTNKQDKCD